MGIRSAQGRPGSAAIAQAGERAKALLQAGRLPEAEKLFRDLLQHERGNFEFVMGLAVACRRRGNLEEAVTLLRRAVNQRPGAADAHAELGLVLGGLGRVDEAIGRCENALRLRPDDYRSLCNIGSLLASQNRPEEALPFFDRAIAVKPDALFPHWHKGIVQLMSGDFESGWKHYARRPGPASQPSGAPTWRGEDGIRGKTVLLRAEQGMGDIVQFVRYAPAVAAKGARVVVEAHEPLLPLLAGAPGVSVVHKLHDALPAHDLQCLTMDLAGVFWTDAASIPAAPYLMPPAGSVEMWQATLGPADRPRIGLVWAGNPSHQNDRNRSMPLAALVPLLRAELADIVVLQKEIAPPDRLVLDSLPRVQRVGEGLRNFADTAGAIAACDLVLTVDTAVAHVAGAMGRPVWIMLPHCPDWRWMLGRADSPWYGSVRLFRQAKPNDWGSVVNDVMAALPGLGSST